MTQQNKEVLEKVQKHTEKKRISLLVNKYTSVNSKLDSLKNFVTNYFWRSEEGGIDFHHYFYSTRNFIFHQFRDFPLKNLIY